MTTFARIADGLHFPTSFTFDSGGTIYVAESGLPFDGAPAGGRIWRLESSGRRTCLKGDLRAPVNGLTCHDDRLYIAEGGNPGRISVLDLDSGHWQPLLDGLPGGGNYHTNMAVVGPDGKLYFGQGSATNSGIVGPDGRGLSWLRKLPHAHDIPGRDVVLTGENAETRISLNGDEHHAVTGSFQPYATRATAGQRIAGQLPCTSAVMRCDPDGTNLELVAWGLRNPYGLGFLPDGRLLAVDLGMNDRGSRPVGHAPECIYVVEAGRWYGWPDYVAGRPVTNEAFIPQRGAPPRFLLANHDELGMPPQPLVTFPAHAAPTRFALDPNSGDLFVALFGDKRPFTGPDGPRAGRSVVRVNPLDGTACSLDTPPLHRPIDVALRTADDTLYVLDFGEFEMLDGGGLLAKAATGALWRLRLAT